MVIYILFVIVVAIVSFSLGVIFSSIKIKDKDIEIALLNEQINKYKKHEEYRKLDIKVLDDDIEIDKMIQQINDERNE